MSTSTNYRYDRRDGPRDRSLRVGDKEREAVGELLRQQHVAGRLDNDEFQARLERSLTAKSYADLDRLIADFPRDADEGRGASWRPSIPLAFAFPFLPLAFLVAVLVTGHVFWLALPLILFFALRPLVWRGRGGGLACSPWALYGPRRAWRA